MGDLELTPLFDRIFDEIIGGLNELKSDISSQKTEKSENTTPIDTKVLWFSRLIWINENITREYLNTIKSLGGSSNELSENLKKEFWFEKIESKITVNMWCFLFYVKKCCNNNFENILPLVYNMMLGSENVITSYIENGYFKKFLWLIETYWDSIYEYLKFCSAFDNSYINRWISHIYGRNFWESVDAMINRYKSILKNLSDAGNNSFSSVEDVVKAKQIWLKNTSSLVQFIENFAEESESMNLFSFLKEYPQKISNLWWKEVETINLSINSWINFAFRWIIEMVKSRTDIDFPHLKDNASETDKNKWKQQWEKIIEEYGNMLRDYIAKDKIDDSDKKQKTFDKIFFTSSHASTLSGSDDDVMPTKDWSWQFSWNDVSDYSVAKSELNTKASNESGDRMLSDIEKYVKDHPNEKILVCINHHGLSDWSSGNWWSKEDWMRLANLSPNIKIRSIRCFFWAAFDDENLYNYSASLSWFSNNTITFTSVTEIINEAWSKNLWFHEMEIYTRLNYPVSITPLTDRMEYENRNTWELEKLNIWLAQNDEQVNNDFDVNYA